ncbi:S-layer homology domain-containing protein [Spirulina major]|uniref:S-layer homology domain-containing protein n=1 Tax=Spirulina major TaxID=270636 RepID=UPI000933486E|nr:S-layer homology domain-containing protein [Spirulina major]
MMVLKTLTWVTVTGLLGMLPAGDAIATQTPFQETTPQVQTETPYWLAFEDVTGNFWANSFIDVLMQRNIISGFPDGEFKPNVPVTLGQFAAMLTQAFEGRSATTSLTNFPSISPGHWSFKSLQTAYQMGFLPTTFDPDQPLTRLDVITTLVRGLGYSYTQSTDSLVNLFSDFNQVPTTVRPAIAAAIMNGLVINNPNTQTLNLSQIATRADVAVLVYQALVSTRQVTAITSPYVIDMNQITTIEQTTETNTIETNTNTDTNTRPARQNCNQGIGNGSEGCDPGNSRPHGGSNDEGGRTPGNK